jgi:hypothetical protein
VPNRRTTQVTVDWRKWVLWGVAVGGVLGGFLLLRRKRRPKITRLHVFPSGNYRFRRRPVRFIVIHHSATRSAEDTRRVLLRRGLSTHYEVERDGTIYEYLDPEKYVAYHAGAANDQSIGIDMTHMPGEPWPRAQLEAAGKLINYLQRRFGIADTVAPDHRMTVDEVLARGYGLIRHRNVKATACPEDFPLTTVA